MAGKINVIGTELTGEECQKIKNHKERIEGLNIHTYDKLSLDSWNLKLETKSII